MTSLNKYHLNSSGIAVPCLPEGKYSVLVAQSPCLSEIVEEMHHDSMQVLRPSTIIEGSDFRRSLETTHTILYIHPQNETHPDKILGYFAFRRIDRSDSEPNIIKLGSLGYRYKNQFDEVLAGAFNFLQNTYPIKSNMYVFCIHRNSLGFRRRLEKLGFRHINSVNEMNQIFGSMGQTDLKMIYHKNEEVFYRSERGDSKTMYVFGHRILTPEIDVLF